MEGQTTFTVATDHPTFAGHFPGQPILPGVVLLDEALHAIAAATGLSRERYQIGSAKFLSTVSPGETLLISYATKESGGVRCEITAEGRKVASFALQLTGA